MKTTRDTLQGFGKRLKTARKLMDYPCSRLAKDCGVDRTRPYRWERGELPALPALVKLAEALNIDLHWLLTGSRWKP